VLVVVLLALALAACGQQAPAAPPATTTTTRAATDFGDTARAFVELAIATDEQAVKLLAAGAERAVDPALRELAGELAAVRRTELHELHTLLETAGVPYVNNHVGHDMPGMPTDAELSTLTSAAAGFDAEFTRLVRAHLAESVVVAESAAESVRHPETRAAAERMAEERTAALARLG
jgi:uncharacterized protein (DUF305 family)